MMVPTGAFGKDNIGIGDFGFSLNHCNMHLESLGKLVKKGFKRNSRLHPNNFSVPGVSDGISMSYDAMRHSLVSRDTSAISIVNHVSGTPYKAVMLIPGCDKNMPAAAMALLHLDRPGYIMCGGSIHPGNLDGKKVDIVSVFQADGAVAAGIMTPEQRNKVLMNACPGPGACGGMYTANSMFTLFEAMGLTPLGSSSTMATEKRRECLSAYKTLENVLHKNLTPSKILSKESFENAVRIISVLGGSTNPILHLLAMAKAGNIDFTEGDFERVSKETPFLGDLMPSGQYRMLDINLAGGTPQVLRYMLDSGHLDGNTRTITGRTLGEDLRGIEYDKDRLLKSGIISPFDNPKLDRGHLVLLQGNLGTGWTKISGSGTAIYEGKAVVFENQRDFMENYAERVKGEGDFIIIRNEGPKSSPGCPEMLRPTTLLVGKYGKEAKIGLLTDGRFSGGSVGGAPIIGHVDESIDHGLIRIIRNGDPIMVNPAHGTMDLCISDEEITKRTRLYDYYDDNENVKNRIRHSPGDLRMYNDLTTTCREGASMFTRYFN